MFHDTHVHLEILLERLKIFEDIREKDKTQIFADLSWKKQIEQMLEKHKWLIQISVDKANLDLVFNMFFDNLKVYFSAGSHPESIQEGKVNDITKMLDFKADILQNKRLVAIGECGLDYYYTKNPKAIEQQKELFEKQIQLAIDLNLPLIIHSREAFVDLFTILKKYPEIYGKFVVHCFTGGLAEMQQIVDLGGKIGVGGIVTFTKNAEKLQQAVKLCPLENFIVETDLPFLAPIPYRGKPCLPEYVEQVFVKIAELKEKKVEEIIFQSEKNSLDLFTKIALD